MTAPNIDELTGCQTPPTNGRGEENRSTSRASNVDNNVPHVSTQPLPCNLPEANEIYVDNNNAPNVSGTAQHLPCNLLETNEICIDNNNAPNVSAQPLQPEANYPTDATTGPADAMPTTSSTTPDCNVCGVRSPNEQPNTANKSPAHCTIPTQGDGRCFFRSVVNGLNCDLQSAQRNPVTGVIIYTMKSLLETARADNLRTMVISHVCEKVCVEPDAAVLSADMPERLQFNPLAERIVFTCPIQILIKSMVGKLEVQSTAEVLGRPIHVSIAPGNHIMEYVPKDVCYKVPLLVKYLPHQDAGHYECILGLYVRIRDISPLLDALELKTKTKEKKKRAKDVKARHKLGLPKNVRKRKSTTSRGGKERRKANERYTVALVIVILIIHSV